MSQKTYTILTWTITALAVVLPFIAWGDSMSWRFENLTAYQLFPLFGLLAWMVMWTHYFTGAIRLSFEGVKKPTLYGGLTAYIVLGSLLLHPGLLAYAQWDIGVGLPPESFYAYVGQGMKTAVILGSIAFLLFLSFEVFDRLKEKQSIKHRWLYVSFSQSIAMLLVFIHGLQLGGRINGGWFLYVWIICGALLIPSIYIIHRNELRLRQRTKTD